jgi:hypothetical protein
MSAKQRSCLNAQNALSSISIIAGSQWLNDLTCKLVFFIDCRVKGDRQLDTFTVRRNLVKKNSVKWLGCLISLVFLMMSCTGTEISQTRVDDAYKGDPVSNILVIAITGNEHNRRTYEKKFVARLKSVGVDAVASEAALPMPPDLQMKKEAILKAVDQYKNDAVIITQLIGRQKEDVFTRGGATRMGFFSYARDPGYSSTSTTVRLETNLYDAKTGKLIWSGQSKTMSRESTDKIINEVIKAVIDNWQKNKLIASRAR